MNQRIKELSASVDVLNSELDSLTAEDDRAQDCVCVAIKKIMGSVGQRRYARENGSTDLEHPQLRIVSRSSTGRTRTHKMSSNLDPSRTDVGFDS